MMTRDQIETAFISVLGIEPRKADVAIIEMMGATPEMMAEYLWDHWMGEPEDVSEDDVLARILDTMKEDE